MHDKHERRIRYAAATALTLGVLAVTLLQFRFHLYGPLNRVLYKTAHSTVENAAGSIVDTTTDTDGDGLPDQVEIQTYGTSAYIADSDSDGISDGDEVKAGTDPNCPQGTACASSGAAASPASAPELPGSKQKETTTSPTETKTPEAIRAFLKQQGVPQEVLAKVDDATLLQVYQETVAAVGTPEASASGSTTPPPTATGPIPSKEHLDLIGKLSPQTIRLLLEQVGANKEELSKLSDEQLKQLVDQVLNQVKK